MPRFGSRLSLRIGRFDAFDRRTDSHTFRGAAQRREPLLMILLLRGLARSRGLTLLFTAVLTASAAAVMADRRPDYKPAAYAIQGATIVPVRGATILPGTVIIRDGVIESVGPADKVEIPFDAEVVDGKGLFVYPGFIDLYTTVGIPPETIKSKTGTGRAIPYNDFALPSTPPDNRSGLTPEFEVSTALDLTDAIADERRGLGFTSLLAAPGGSIATGQSAIASLSGLPRREALIKSPVALHINVRPPGGFLFGNDHDVCHMSASEMEAMAAGPRSDEIDSLSTRINNGPMADPPALVLAISPAGRGNNRPPISFPMSLMGAVSHLRQAMLDSEHAHSLDSYYELIGGSRPAFDPTLRALYAARIKTLPVWWEANSRDEIHRVLDLADEFGTTAVIVGGRDAWRVSDRLRSGNIPVVYKIDFPDEPTLPSEAEYRKKKVKERDDALATLKIKNDRWKERVAGVSVLNKAGVKIALATDGLTKTDTIHAQVRKLIAAGLPLEAAIESLTIRPAEIAGLDKRLGTIEPGKLGHLVVFSASYGDEKAKPRYVFADGLKFDLEKTPAGASKKAFGKGAATKGDDKAAESKEAPETKKGEARKRAGTPTPDDPKIEPKAVEPKEAVKADPKEAPKNEDEPKEKGGDKPKETEEELPFADVATEFESTRKPSFQTGGNVFIKNAKILTASPQGTIEKGSILVVGGKIRAIGPDVTPLPDSKVIDAEGMVAMPGIIDTHSHMAIAGGVNEMSLSIVADVRVKDVISGDDTTIYRAAAGGTTSARLLHGSANTIGGQDAVIKLKYGLAGRDLLIKDGPQGIKFALGENVTRSRGRFPNTRMGVEAVIERAFLEGQAYKAMWQSYKADLAVGKKVPPPRKDLRLEAMAGILDGSIKIHSHCYRSDEILMLLRTAERFGVRVQSLQHVLEGYKVAAEIAAHGASSSTFSDWWAYKVEAYDAIPHNAALITKAGGRVCIKSDSEELVRHLYLEAAKMLKYGTADEQTALSYITINPAKELGLDHRIGSLEVGKDGDIALFNSHPFNAFARCELTLIEGEVYFERQNAKLSPHESGTKMPTSDGKGKSLDVAVNPKGLYVIVGANVHPVSGPDIADGVVVIDAGKIAAIGGPSLAIPTNAQVIDAKGFDVWPGLVDAGTPVGLIEIGSLDETKDFADSAQYQPELRTSTALHPDSEIIPVTRANGILTSFVMPSGGIIAGQGAAVEWSGWIPTEMTIRDGVGLVINLPTYVAVDPDSARRRGGGAAAGGDDAGNNRRKERLDAIKDEFTKALAYDKVRTGAVTRKVNLPTPDPRLVALLPFAKGEKLVIFRASHKVEILDALAMIKDLKLKGAITGGTEAWKVASELKAANVPVLVAGTLVDPGGQTEPYDAAYANPGKLFAAGVPFAIRSIGGGPDQATAARNLPYEAATAVAYGLPEAEAIKAVTINPAKILGIDDLVGSLEVGKRANLVISAGHILQPTTEVKVLFIGGKPIAPESKQTKLYAKYSQRLDEVQAGSAPLGLDRPKSNRTTPSVPAAGTAGVGAGSQR